MNFFGVSLSQIGYGLTGLAYLLLSVLLLTSFRGRLRGGLLATAAVVTALWAAFLAWGTRGQSLSPLQVIVAEFIHDAVWLIFLSALLSGAVGAARYWIVRYGGIVLVTALLVIGIGQEWYLTYDVRTSGSGYTLTLGSLLTAVYALVLVEQIYRNARESQRSGLKFLCLGVGAIFAYDLFLYSNAILMGEISELYWVARGFVVAMSVPLIAVAAQRSPSWSVGIFVSRQVAFYTATLFGAGVYLSVIGIGGYYIGIEGGQWGSVAQVVFFAAAVIGLFVFLFSDKSRARLRVFISKHFYENKYDYREEWLRLIDTLTSDKESLPLKKRGVKALAQILDAPAGMLWLLSRDVAEYRCVAGWNIQKSDAAIDAEDDLVKFLQTSGWVVDLTEYKIDPSHYQEVWIDTDKIAFEDANFVIPLLHDGSLNGFVVLGSPNSPSQLNFEDRDLLKTAGQQIASYLSQEMATEQLAEGRQFEAFNKLTAYLMHDLKNVIAQQSLVVENAQKHKNNPVFIDDAIATIKGSVVRMRRVIEHLQHGAPDRPLERIELSKLVMQAVSQCGDRDPVPHARVGESRIWVRADKERLLMALLHAIRNAQDATPANGDVTVSLNSDVDRCTIEVVDTGKGMDDAFIRDRLFKPFDSTKGTQGMGIGAYQIRETLRALGGDVHIQSSVDQGTTVRIDLRSAGTEKV